MSSTSQEKNSVLFEAQIRDRERSSSNLSDNNNYNSNKENDHFLPKQSRINSDIKNNNENQYSPSYNSNGPSLRQPNRMNYFSGNSNHNNDLHNLNNLDNRNDNNNNHHFNRYSHNPNFHDMTNNETIDSGIAKVYLKQRNQDNDEVKKLLLIHIEDTTRIKNLTEQVSKKDEELNDLRQISISQKEQIEKLESELQRTRQIIDKYEINEKRLDDLDLFNIPIGRMIKNQLSDEKEPSISIVKPLREKIPNVIGFLTTDYSKNVDVLKKENENLRNMNEKITQDVEIVLQEKFNSISQDLLKNIENLNIVNENKVVEKFDECKQLFNELETLRKEMSTEQLKSQKLEFELENIKGNSTEKLTFNNLKRPIVTSEKYNSLKLDLLDKYNIVQLQNLIKRTSIELGLSIDSLEVNLPRITVLLGLFSLLLKFTVWLSEEFLDVNLDFHKQVEKCIDTYLQTGDKDKSKKSLERILHKLEEIIIERFDHESGYEE